MYSAPAQGYQTYSAPAAGAVPGMLSMLRPCADRAATHLNIGRLGFIAMRAANSLC